MLKKIVLVFAALALAKAQIPNLGWCPEYSPMANFDLSKFLGVWYEEERYFQLSELVSRCVVSNYTKGFDGKVRVINEVMNRLTGIKRVVEGEIKPSPTKAEEGRLHVKYTAVPLAPETQYSVLETDYDNYAILWSCSSLGLAHTQNAWLMTRNRYPTTKVLQMAYGAMDKNGISKRFFVKTDQTQCAFDPPAAPAAAALVPAAAPIPVAPPAAAETPVLAPAAASAPIKEETVVPEAGLEKQVHLRSSGLLEEAEPAQEIPKAEMAVKSSPAAEKPAEELRVASAEPAKEASPKPVAPETVPEVILKVAEVAKPAAEPQPEATPIAEESKVQEVVVSAEPEKKKPDVVAEPQMEPMMKAVEPAAVQPAEAAVKPEEPAAIDEPKEKPAAVIKPVEPVPEAAPVTKEKIETPAAVAPLQEAAAPMPEKSALPESMKDEKLAEVPVAVPEVTDKSESVREAAKPESVAAEPTVPETPPIPASIPMKNSEVAAEETKPQIVAELAKIAETKP